MKAPFAVAVLVLLAESVWPTPVLAQDDVADVPSEELVVKTDEASSYFLIGPLVGKPKSGCGLIVVLPGGTGGKEYLPFVKRIYKHSVPPGFVLAQAVAPSSAESNDLVWPTTTNPSPKMTCATDRLIAAIIRDVRSRQTIDERRIFLMGWSSGGPAVYASSLNIPEVRGCLIAMSVFKPDELPPLERAAARRYYLYHSPNDQVTPIEMARQAVERLAANGAVVELATYAGGHGWKPGLYQDIRQGFDWLLAANRVAPESAKPSENRLRNPGFEEGQDSPTAWSQGVKVSGVEYRWEKSEANSGEASICLSKTARRFFPVAQWSALSEKK